VVLLLVMALPLRMSNQQLQLLRRDPSQAPKNISKKKSTTAPKSKCSPQGQQAEEEEAPQKKGGAELPLLL
jgi:hypothetical protein